MHISSTTLHSEKFPDSKTYPFNLPVFRSAGRIDFASNITFFAGENGSGKSTLLKAICRKCGIHIWSEECWSRAHYNPYENSLFQFLDIAWTGVPKPGTFFSAEIFEHMTTMIDIWASTDPKLLDYFGGKSLLEQSHGESFMSFFTSRYTLEGVYFLDEPETALSPKRQLSFVKFLEETGRAGRAQFFIATHSPILLSCPGASILSFDGEAVKSIPYEKTEHYRVYRDFIMDRHTRNGRDVACTS
ncbi:MAG: AAA family ATPase [Chitinispirillaceae bacterium]|nr:AAA family ATPase [Chitinispirillaceae bacterium]